MTKSLVLEKTAKIEITIIKWIYDNSIGRIDFKINSSLVGLVSPDNNSNEKVPNVPSNITPSKSSNDNNMDTGIANNNFFLFLEVINSKV